MTTRPIFRLTDQTQPQAATASETPETDAQPTHTNKIFGEVRMDVVYVPRDHARSLETRLTRANALCDKLAEALEMNLRLIGWLLGKPNGFDLSFLERQAAVSPGVGLGEAALAAYRESKKGQQ